MYTIIDLIDKLIEITKDGEKTYIELSNNQLVDSRVRILGKVFSIQESKNIYKYNDIKAKIQDGDDIEIDFFTYDKAAKLIYDFMKIYKTKTEIDSINKAIDVALVFEKEVLALVLSVMGVLVKSEEDMNSRNYKILKHIVDDKKKLIHDLENLKKRRI